MNANNKYLMFVDESGDSNLNHRGGTFILSTIIINKNDFQIIQGYLRLLKRSYFGDDYINIHMTDLCERPYMKYRKIVRPTNRLNSFIERLISIVKVIPFRTGLYYLDKDKLRNELGYIPRAGRTPDGFDLDLAYELLSIRAFNDFSQFLNNKKTHGEIIVESRYPNDGKFVGYFDQARKKNLSGNIINPMADIVRERINSVTISNKKESSGGLELTDIAAYSILRKIEGDPFNKLKINISKLYTLFNEFKNHSYIETAGGRAISLVEVRK